VLSRTTVTFPLVISRSSSYIGSIGHFSPRTSPARLRPSQTKTRITPPAPYRNTGKNVIHKHSPCTEEIFLRHVRYAIAQLDSSQVEKERVMQPCQPGYCPCARLHGHIRRTLKSELAYTDLSAGRVSNINVYIIHYNAWA
jgi:hypothetical protein